MSTIATQKSVVEAMVKWREATGMKEAVEAAREAATEWDSLYEESAMNLLKRTPDLLGLLAAFQAGREAGVQEEVERRQPVQEKLIDG